ncbi:hypothetical protein KIN20_014090 [Parelaphostrongylus tenuis]|uniref:Uncharacterized protein n=1 Tax=Parelaphostrongylus tenuis TaxID=148309 RepID=A0AAD5N2T6_PARTN|nr:hypothetical protein KIN20_014090 [Parelaphostrongylus tenuis]
MRSDDWWPSLSLVEAATQPQRVFIPSSIPAAQSDLLTHCQSSTLRQDYTALKRMYRPKRQPQATKKTLRPKRRTIDREKDNDLDGVSNDRKERYDNHALAATSNQLYETARREHQVKSNDAEDHLDGVQSPNSTL